MVDNGGSWIKKTLLRKTKVKKKKGLNLKSRLPIKLLKIWMTWTNCEECVSEHLTIAFLLKIYSYLLYFDFFC
jgi:hypothetical protein